MKKAIFRPPTPRQPARYWTRAPGNDVNFVNGWLCAHSGIEEPGFTLDQKIPFEISEHARINNQGVIISEDRLWRNGRGQSVQSLIPAGGGAGFSQFDLRAINDSGAIAATALSASRNDRVPVMLVPVQIAEVSFGGAKYWRLDPDDMSTTYEAPQWKDGLGTGTPANIFFGDDNYPVAFTRNTKLKIGAKFRIANASNLGAVKIKAAGPGGMAIPETAATVSGEEAVLSLTETSSALVNTIKFYDGKDDAKAFKLEWEVKIGNSGWFKIGTTKHTVYVTLDDPKTAFRQESLFEISCRNADGIDQAAAVTDAIWNEFTDLVVKRVDGTQLTYYNSYLCNNTTTGELLQFGDGQCGAWAKFFIDLRKVQGINDVDEYVMFYSKPGTADGFLVKNWNFSGSGTSGVPGFPYMNILETNWVGPNGYNWKRAEVTDAQGIPGQGNPNPASMFVNHQVVISGQYYDPSYGIKPAGLLAIDNNTIAGFSKGPLWVALDEPVVNLDLNNDGDKTDIGVQALVMYFKKNPVGIDLEEQRTNY